MCRKTFVLGLILVLVGAYATSAREIEVNGRVLAENGKGLQKAAIELQPLRTPWQLAQRQLKGDY